MGSEVIERTKSQTPGLWFLGGSSEWWTFGGKEIVSGYKAQETILLFPLSLGLIIRPDFLGRYRCSPCGPGGRGRELSGHKRSGEYEPWNTEPRVSWLVKEDNFRFHEPLVWNYLSSHSRLSDLWPWFPALSPAFFFFFFAYSCSSSQTPFTYLFPWVPSLQVSCVLGQMGLAKEEASQVVVTEFLWQPLHLALDHTEEACGDL